MGFAWKGKGVEREMREERRKGKTSSRSLIGLEARRYEGL